jgi:hypothetical protein
MNKTLKQMKEKLHSFHRHACGAFKPLAWARPAGRITSTSGLNVRRLSDAVLSDGDFFRLLYVHQAESRTRLRIRDAYR